MKRTGGTSAKDTRAALLAWPGPAHALGSGQSMVLGSVFTWSLGRHQTKAVAMLARCPGLALGRPGTGQSTSLLLKAITLPSRETLSKAPAGNSQLVPASRWCQGAAGKGWLARAEPCWEHLNTFREGQHCASDGEVP